MSRTAAALGLSLLVSLTVLPRSAEALQGGEDPDKLPVLIDKKFSLGGQHQLSLLFSTAMATKFVDSQGVFVAYHYGFSEILGLELAGAAFFGGESAIMAQIRAKSDGEPSLSDLYQLRWLAMADLVVVPLYGKISFFSAFDPAFDVFFVVGGGVAGARRQQGVGTAGTESYLQATTPVFNFGLGLRFYVLRGARTNVALRLELRDYFFPEPDPSKSGLTFDLHFQGGLQVAFGGS